MEPRYIGVAGDWHGNTLWAAGAIRQMAEKLAELGEEHPLVLQLGDFGLWPGHGGEKYLRTLNKGLELANARLWFVDGNHDNHDRLDRELAKWQLAEKAGIPIGGVEIWWLPRGFTWSWHGRRWMALGGAVSVDKALRYPPRKGEGKAWWEQEEITDAQEAAAIGKGKVDVLVTHDCPSKVVHALPPPPPSWLPQIARAEAHRERLQRVVDACQPQHVMHGHLHRHYQRTCDFGYGPVEVTGLDMDGEQGNWHLLDVQNMEWK